MNLQIGSSLSGQASGLSSEPTQPTNELDITTRRILGQPSWLAPNERCQAVPGTRPSGDTGNLENSMGPLLGLTKGGLAKPRLPSLKCHPPLTEGEAGAGSESLKIQQGKAQKLQVQAHLNCCLRNVCVSISIVLL